VQEHNPEKTSLVANLALHCMEQVLISVVCPVYHGEMFLGELIEKLDAERASMSKDYPQIELREVIFVVDDAQDGSRGIIAAQQKERSWIRLIDLSNNFGQHAATIAGILHSSGDWIFTIDEDLQHDPKHFVAMLKNCVSASDDICYASSQHGAHGSFLRDRISVWFKFLMAFLLQDKGIRKFYSYRLIRGSIARAAAAVAGPGTYLDMALLWFTKRSVQYKTEMTDFRYQSDSRSSGYGIWSLVRHAKRLIFSSNLQFLRIGLVVGLGLLVLGLLIWLGSVLSFIPSISIEFAAMLSLGGIITLFLGFLIEISAQLLLHSKGKPTFFAVNRDQDDALRKMFE